MIVLFCLVNAIKGRAEDTIAKLPKGTTRETMCCRILAGSVAPRGAAAVLVVSLQDRFQETHKGICTLK